MKQSPVIPYLAARAMGIALEQNIPHFQAMAQPAVYLAQHLGVPLAYRFQPSSNGVFSSQLQADYYEIHGDIDAETDPDQKFLPQYQNALQQVYDLKSRTPRHYHARAWMQSLAALAYAADHAEDGAAARLHYIDHVPHLLNIADPAAGVYREVR